jgi:hypothetical protein
MTAPAFALIVGIAYTAAGVLGMFSLLVVPPPATAPVLSVQSQYGMMFGLFAVNSVLNGLHILIGVWGLTAWSGATSAVRYARVVAVLTAVIAVMGLIPGPNIAFGVMPLYGVNVVVHAATAIVAAYIGFRSKARRRAHGERRHGSAADRREALRPVAHERRRGFADRRFGGSTLASGF